jgi:tRNA (guanine26-N2/guanine27-N2)-dimethyltransferase
MMHETGLRILLGFICREAAKYDKGIEPIVSYSSDHYFRVYVKIKHGKQYANDSMENFSFINSNKLTVTKNRGEQKVGPLWTGNLQRKKEIKQIRTLLFEKQLNTKNSLWKLLSRLEEEAGAKPFFYTTNDLASYLKTAPPKIEYLFEKIRQKGFTISRTHFSNTGFKTDAPFDEIKEAFKEQSR